MSEGTDRPLLTTEGTEHPPVEDRPFKTNSTFFGVRRMMVIWTGLGLAVAAFHHGLNRYLDGRPAQKGLPFVNKYFNYQQVVSAAGNFMALIVSTCFQAAIRLLFVQQFWFLIRRRSFSARQINSIITIQRSPISLSAFSVIKSAGWLFTVASVTFSLSIISVVVPGSLPIRQSNFTEKISCEVPQLQLQFPGVVSNYVFTNPNDSTANLANSSLPAIRNLAGVVLLLKSYLPPATPCGQCKYSITINAPVIDCKNISSPGDSTTVQHETAPTRRFIDPSTSGTGISPNDGYGVTPILVDNFVWNATYSLNKTGLLLLATWKSGSFKDDNYSSQVSAAACSASIATYSVDVVHDISATTMTVTSVIPHNNLIMPDSPANATFNETVSMFAMVDALASQIQGALSFDPNGNPVSQTSMASYTMGTINNGYWDWPVDPLLAISLMMQNLTLSMLATNLGSDPHQSTVGSVSQECWSSLLAFHYDGLRLAGTYAAGALVTILCVVIGFWIVKQNDMDESFDFSRWMDGLVHADILDEVQSKDLTQDSRFQVRESDNRLTIPLLAKKF